jgi:ankyrin repeat protein
MKLLYIYEGINVNATDNIGWTPLHEASNHGHTECVLELLKFIPSKTMDVFFTKGNTCNT